MSQPKGFSISEYPRFSNGEMSRRREAVEAIAGDRDVSHVVVSGSRGSTSIPWLTGWPVTNQAIAVLTPEEPVQLFVQLYNHVPNAQKLASIANVTWGGPDTFEAVTDTIEARGGGTVGSIGDLPHRGAKRLLRSASPIVDMSEDYTKLRMVKSAEEIDWMRIGASLTDDSLDALLDVITVGATELDYVAAVESSYLAQGGTNHIHFIASTPMANPQRFAPFQWPSSRATATGDVILTELSTSNWGYPGQVLRTIIADEEPTKLYRELHDLADAAFEAVAAEVRHGAHARDLFEASRIIGEAGYTIFDDLVHGFGGGYLPPVIGTDTRLLEPVPDVELESGMTIVIQPNVVTLDHQAGVQTGELILVTETGFERLHKAPTGLLRSSQTGLLRGCASHRRRGRAAR